MAEVAFPELSPWSAFRYRRSSSLKSTEPVSSRGNSIDSEPSKTVLTAWQSSVGIAIVRNERIERINMVIGSDWFKNS